MSREAQGSPVRSSSSLRLEVAVRLAAKAPAPLKLMSDEIEEEEATAQF